MLNRGVIAVIGAAGTIGQKVVEWLEAWGIAPLRRDFRSRRTSTWTFATPALLRVPSKTPPSA